MDDETRNHARKHSDDRLTLQLPKPACFFKSLFKPKTTSNTKPSGYLLCKPKYGTFLCVYNKLHSVPVDNGNVYYFQSSARSEWVCNTLRWRKSEPVSLGLQSFCWTSDIPRSWSRPLSFAMTLSLSAHLPHSLPATQGPPSGNTINDKYMIVHNDGIIKLPGSVKEDIFIHI